MTPCRPAALLGTSRPSESVGRFGSPGVGAVAVLYALLAFPATAKAQEPVADTPPEDLRRLVALADELVRADRIPEAEDALRRVLLQRPDATPVAVNRASLLFRLSRYAEAEEVLRGVLDRSPDHPLAHYFLGAIAMRAGGPGGVDAEAAAHHAEAALAGLSDHNPAALSQRAEAYHLLGEARLALGDGHAGEAAVRASLELAPFQPGPRYLLGRHLIRTGRVEAGKQELEVFAKAKAASEAVAEAASLFHDGNQTTVAEAHLRRALTLWPDYSDALQLLATILASTGRVTEANAIQSRLRTLRTVRTR